MTSLFVVTYTFAVTYVVLHGALKFWGKIILKRLIMHILYSIYSVLSCIYWNILRLDYCELKKEILTLCIEWTQFSMKKGANN